MRPLTVLLTLPLLASVAACQTLPQSTATPPATGVAISWPNREEEHRQWCRLTPLELSHNDTTATKAQGVALNTYADPVCGRSAPK